VISSWRKHGCGRPVTLVAHGLGATEGEARLPASGLSGTRVVVTFGSHGDAADAPAAYWDYGVLADELRAVAEVVDARQAVGLSMGAGALIRLASEDPGRFDRLALLQPPALDGRRPAEAVRAMQRLSSAVLRDDRDALRRLVVDALPTCSGCTGDYVERRVGALLRLGDALRILAGRVPVCSAFALAAVPARVLVVSGVGDPMHPEAVATTTAAAFPDAELHVLGSSCPLLTHRTEIRTLLAAFLGVSAVSAR
jgi:pimeloyl-ACP methyl ester carboxylesterase